MTVSFGCILKLINIYAVTMLCLYETCACMRVKLGVFGGEHVFPFFSVYVYMGVCLFRLLVC